MRKVSPSGVVGIVIKCEMSASERERESEMSASERER